MRITKFGHSCLLVEAKGARILIDPGTYSTAQNNEKNLDAILITHDHADHWDQNSLKTILANNPSVIIYTNQSVGEKLKQENISFTLLEHNQSAEVKGVAIAGIGEKHAVIYSEIPVIPNTGYMIAGRLFVPGDAFTLPGRVVEILALPVCAPWLKILEATDYAKAVHPRVVFPIHDGMLKPKHPFYNVPSVFLPKAGIEWTVIEVGESVEL